MKWKSWLKASFIAALMFVSLSFVDNYFEINKNLEILTNVYREVDRLYVDNIEPNDFMKTGIAAMLKSLDPYTVFYSESEIEDFRFMTTGKYGGIGAVVTKLGDRIVISEPYEGSPALKAGLMAGDELIDIDGKSTEGKNIEDISKMLKGQPNSIVNVKVKRIGEKELKLIPVTRGEINVNSVPYFGMIDNEVGYVKLDAFREGCAKEVQEAIEDLKNKKGMKKLVFDLRDNGGGSLDEAVRIAGFFIPKNSLVVDTRGKSKDWDKKYFTPAAPILLEMPVTVLINNNSASASEIVAGVIQDYDRGVIIGQRSFGKGLVQTVRPLNYNTQIKITTAKYYTPSGRCVQEVDYANHKEKSKKDVYKTKNGRVVYGGGGVTPDVETKEDKGSAILAHLVVKGYIFDYVTQYRANNATLSNTANKYVFTNSDFDTFKKYVSSKDMNYEIQSEKQLHDYINKVKEENYYPAIETELKAIESKLAGDKKNDLDKFNESIKQFISNEVVSRYFYQKGRIENSFLYDIELKQALNLFTKTEEFNAILQAPKK